jgi:hypothetical protein
VMGTLRSPGRPLGTGHRDHPLLGCRVVDTATGRTGVLRAICPETVFGPGPDHSGHCMKERLTTISNNCPAAVYTRDGRTTQPCTGDRCIGVNQFQRPMGDGRTHSTQTDSPTSFVDLHRTFNQRSLLEGTGVSSCSAVCEQIYTCDRIHPTSGKFRITRNYQAGTHTKRDGTTMHVTTGNVTKTAVP